MALQGRRLQSADTYEHFSTMPEVICTHVSTAQDLKRLYFVDRGPFPYYGHKIIAIDLESAYMPAFSAKRLDLCRHQTLLLAYTGLGAVHHLQNGSCGAQGCSQVFGWLPILASWMRIWRTGARREVWLRMQQRANA